MSPAQPRLEPTLWPMGTAVRQSAPTGRKRPVVGQAADTTRTDPSPRSKLQCGPADNAPAEPSSSARRVTLSHCLAEHRADHGPTREAGRPSVKQPQPTVRRGHCLCSCRAADGKRSPADACGVQRDARSRTEPRPNAPSTAHPAETGRAGGTKSWDLCKGPLTKCVLAHTRMDMRMHARAHAQGTRTYAA